MSHSTFCNQWHLGHALIEKVLFDKLHLLSKPSYTLSLKKKVLVAKSTFCHHIMYCSNHFG